MRIYSLFAQLQPLYHSAKRCTSVLRHPVYLCSLILYCNFQTNASFSVQSYVFVTYSSRAFRMCRISFFTDISGTLLCPFLLYYPFSLAPFSNFVPSSLSHRYLTCILLKKTMSWMDISTISIFQATLTWIKKSLYSTYIETRSAAFSSIVIMAELIENKKCLSVNYNYKRYFYIFHSEIEIS